MFNNKLENIRSSSEIRFPDMHENDIKNDLIVCLGS